VNLRALFFVSISLSITARSQTAGSQTPASAGILGQHELLDIEQFPPQQQAERLLERAISRYQGALEQIGQRLPAWVESRKDGKLTYSKKLESLIDIALNSSELPVRAAAVELTLASQGIAKEPAKARDFMDQIRSTSKDRSWRLWILGLLAGRGIETGQIRYFLLEFLRDPDEETREWAVNALSMLGTDDIIDPLLEVFGRDPSMAVRERAGCGLAEGGMMTREQRRKAIPGLMRMMDDPTLNQETQVWVFQALTEISSQHLGSDRAAWHAWDARH
jgi:hypothetical protein